MIPITKEQFESNYISKNGIDKAFYKKRFITLPCNCKEKGCKGFASVSNTDICIKIHNDLYR